MTTLLDRTQALLERAEKSGDTAAIPILSARLEALRAPHDPKVTHLGPGHHRIEREAILRATIEAQYPGLTDEQYEMLEYIL